MRFFFADAAATGYARYLVGAATIDALTLELNDVIDHVNHGLMLIVGTFIQGRGYSFRSEREP
jgi:hypothetical protein